MTPCVFSVFHRLCILYTETQPIVAYPVQYYNFVQNDGSKMTDKSFCLWFVVGNSYCEEVLIFKNLRCLHSDILVVATRT